MRGGLRSVEGMRSMLGTINVSLEIEPSKEHTKGGGSRLVVLAIQDDIGLLEVGDVS